MNTIHNSQISGTSEALSLFESLAKLTWNWLDDARRLSLGFSEDTISDLSTLEIARSQTNRVGVKRVSKQRERFGGFDWLWLIRRPGAPLAIYVVQAKKLKLDDTTAYSYGKLKYKSGTGYQIDALQAFADHIGATPLYCFYNHVDNQTASSHWHCSQGEQPEQMGCTLVPLQTVKDIHDDRRVRNDFYSVHNHTEAVPWRCLFHPGCADFGVDNWGKHSTNAYDPKTERLDSLWELVWGGEEAIDIDVMIRELQLDELIDLYAAGRFLPIPERIPFIDLRE